MIRRLAPHVRTALISGETGTGKELVARALHQTGPRRERRFITVNCSAVVETLFESELFGHVRGAFTGATQDRVGLFESANGGTLLLDEVGDLPLAMQVKLLRVLQEREFRRVGENRTRTVDVRVLAATHRDLAGEVSAERFRQDLYYRLRVIELRIPPLRERRDDILPIARQVLAETAARMKLPVTGFSQPLTSCSGGDGPAMCVNFRTLSSVRSCSRKASASRWKICRTKCGMPDQVSGHRAWRRPRGRLPPSSAITS